MRWGGTQRPREGFRERLRGNEQLLIVCGLVASTQMTWGIVVPVLPVYARDLGASPAQLGLVVAIFGLGRLVANLPAGAAADRFNDRRLLLSSVAAVVVLTVLTGLATSLTQLLALRLLSGVAGGVAITTGNVVLVKRTTVRTRGRAMSTLQGFQLAGGAFGPALGGVVAATAGARASFLVSGLVALACVVWGSFRLSPSPRPITLDVDHDLDLDVDGAPSSVRRPRPLQVPLLGNRSFVAVCIIGFAEFFSRFGGRQFLVPLIAYEEVGIGVGELGLALGMVTMGNVFLVSFAGGLSDRVGRKPVIVSSVIFVGAGTAAYLVADTATIFYAVLLGTGLGQAFSGPTPAAYLADVAPEGRQGPAVGIYRSFGDLAGLIAPVALGWLIVAAGYDAGILVLAAVMVVAGIAFALIAQETAGAKAVGRSAPPQPTPAANPRPARPEQPV